jgi:quercetin dioxygenase-like cupin family protein
VKVRRVVTGHDAQGADTIVSDDVLANEPTADPQLIELWRIPGPPEDPHAGHAPQGGERTIAEPGAIAWRLFVLPPGERHLHRTDTLDMLQVLDGEVVVMLDGGDVTLHPNDCLVLRGENHGWRNDSTEPATLAAVMVGTARDNAPLPETRVAGTPRGVAPRRVVAGVDDSGKSIVATDGEPPNQLIAESSGYAMIDLWQTMAPVERLAQGGDLPAGTRVDLMPAGGGIFWRQVTVPPMRPAAAAAAPQRAEATTRFNEGSAHRDDDPSIHRTESVDFILVRRGEVWLEVPGAEPRHLKPGDTVVQRGTWHAWRNRGDEPCTFSAVMIQTPPLAR